MREVSAEPMNWAPRRPGAPSGSGQVTQRPLSHTAGADGHSHDASVAGYSAATNCPLATSTRASLTATGVLSAPVK
jgi:hypothetical protein